LAWYELRLNFTFCPLGELQPLDKVKLWNEIALIYVRTKTDYLRIRIMCKSGATCPSVNCCLIELAFQTQNPAKVCQW
jgi:hypothetical protein